MRFSARLQQLPQMVAHIHAEAVRAGLEGEEVKRVELAVEEILVNIITHAYTESEGEIEIDCSPTPALQITVRDRGIPFNPLDHVPRVDRDTPLEERPIGGWGVFFVRELMDELAYTREGETNVLTLTKKKI